MPNPTGRSAGEGKEEMGPEVGSPTDPVYDRGGLPFLPFQNHWCFPRTHKSLHYPRHRPLPQTIHVACPSPKEWSVISMVKLNPFHLNMHQQGPIRTGASFITFELALACARRPRFVFESWGKDDGSRDVIGKANEHLSPHQTV